MMSTLFSAAVRIYGSEESDPVDLAQFKVEHPIVIQLAANGHPSARLGATIEGAGRFDFADAQTVFKIEEGFVPIDRTIDLGEIPSEVRYLRIRYELTDGPVVVTATAAERRVWKPHARAA